MTQPSFIELCKKRLGSAHVISDPARMDFYVTDYRKRFAGKALAVVQPGNTQEVADIVRLCRRHGIPIVPQGGNTGLVLGSVPDTSGKAVVISLARMKRIRETDLANNTMTVEAGCLLDDIHKAAQDADRMFPLSLASSGSCMIGGNLAANAGGTAVLRYGTARELCLGLEVVLPDGAIWDGLYKLRKNNTGYDLRDLFIGRRVASFVHRTAVRRRCTDHVRTDVALQSGTGHTAFSGTVVSPAAHAGLLCPDGTFQYRTGRTCRQPFRKTAPVCDGRRRDLRCRPGADAFAIEIDVGIA